MLYTIIHLILNSYLIYYLLELSISPISIVVIQVIITLLSINAVFSV